MAAAALHRVLRVGSISRQAWANGAFARRRFSSSRALAAYRRLLRASSKLFSGDDFALKESRLKLRSEFAANRDITDEARLEQMFSDVVELEDFLRHNVVQGKLNERGNFVVKLTSHQSTEQCAEAVRPVDQA